METQTAMQWLEKTIGRKNMNSFLKAVVDEAKEKEKEYLDKLKEFDEWKEWKHKED